MKTILALIVVFLLFSSSGVQARTSYRQTEMPIIAENKVNMGKVFIQRRDDLLYMDYDLDGYQECQLQSITTNMRNWNQDYTFNTNNSDSRKLSYPDTYIAPRDAVVAIDVGNRSLTEKIQFTSKLRFNCDGNKRLAWVSSKENQTYQATDQIDQHRRQKNRNPIRRSLSTPLPDDGYERYYDSNRNQWIWRNRNQSALSSSGSQSTRTTITRRVSDAYRLVYNRTRNWWTYVTNDQLTKQNNQVILDKDRDPYELAYNEDKGWWEWR